MRVWRVGLMMVVTVCAFLVATVPAGAEARTIRMGVLPALGTMPLRVAVADGLFAKQGLNVELVAFNSAFERDTAMRTGNIDGYFGDLVAAVLMRKAGVDVRVVTVCTRSEPGQRMFGLVTSPGMSVLPADRLRGKSVGLSTSTVIEYLLDLMEKGGGVPGGALERVDVKKLPVRVQMLMNDKLDLALVPEPLASLAEFRGGRVVATAENLDIPLTIVLLRTELAENSRVRRNFLAAYAEAARRLRHAPEAYRDVMVRDCRIPKPLAPDFPIPRYPDPALPAAGAVRNVQEWMVQKGIIVEPFAFEHVVAESL